jgi:hypothetical protein
MLYYVVTVCSGGPCRVGPWDTEREAAGYVDDLARWWPYRAEVVPVPEKRSAGRRRTIVGVRRSPAPVAAPAPVAGCVGVCDHGAIGVLDGSGVCDDCPQCRAG